MPGYLAFVLTARSKGRCVAFASDGRGRGGGWYTAAAVFNLDAMT